MCSFLEVKIEVFLKGKVQRRAYRKQTMKLEASQGSAAFCDLSHKRKGIKEKEENFHFLKEKVSQHKYRPL